MFCVSYEEAEEEDHCFRLRVGGGFDQVLLDVPAVSFFEAVNLGVSEGRVLGSGQSRSLPGRQTYCYC